MKRQGLLSLALLVVPGVIAMATATVFAQVPPVERCCLYTLVQSIPPATCVRTVRLLTIGGCDQPLTLGNCRYRPMGECPTEPEPG